ncbi:MAG: conjugal transfer protein TraF [Bacteroidota bacterium]|nr:conjugal transfer protein TraF [Bacteroidota bacterium]
MKRLFTLAVLLIISHKLLAQHESTAFTVTGSGLASTLSNDYQCIGINPANLGVKSGKRLNLGFAETSVGIFSNALNKEDLRDIFNTYTSNNSTANNFSSEDKKRLAKSFADKGISANIDFTWIGVSLKIPKVGGFAFSVREHITSKMVLNANFSDIIFNGYKATYFDTTFVINGDTTGFSNNPELISKITEGSKVQLSWVREYNLGFGRTFINNDNFKLSLGTSVKYLNGVAVVDVSSKDGELNAYSGISNSFLPGLSQIQGKFTNSTSISNAVGQGFGLDLGANIKMKNLTFAASINNVGYITYIGELFKLNDAKLDSIKNNGINNYLAESNSEFGTGEDFFDKTLVSKQSFTLPVNFRGGVLVEITKRLHVGADVYVPLNQAPGKYANTYASVGVQGRVSAVKLSTGLGIGTGLKLVVPLGIVFAPSKGVYEIGFASRDLFTFFTDKNPNLSGSFGFLRFGLFNLD